MVESAGMEQQTARRLVVSGSVQGVGFRAFAQHAARALGLSSRYALYRLMKKHGIDSDVPPAPRTNLD